MTLRQPTGEIKGVRSVFHGKTGECIHVLLNNRYLPTYFYLSGQNPRFDYIRTVIIIYYVFIV